MLKCLLTALKGSFRRTVHQQNLDKVDLQAFNTHPDSFAFSARVQAMIDAYKFKTEWEENHMVGVHVRRGDLTIYGKNVSIVQPGNQNTENIL